MGHRHVFNNTTQVFETDSDQGWNQAEQPYIPFARGASESSSIVHPVDNMTIQGVHFPSQWTHAPRSSGYSPPILNNELSHYQPMPPITSHEPFLHQSAAGGIHMLPDNYFHRPSSSNIGEQPVHGVDSSCHDQTIGSSRGPYKRKSPGIPPMCDRGSTSRYYDVGSSSEFHLPADQWQQEKQDSESCHSHWEYPQTYAVNGHSVGSEGTLRNVRSRAGVDLEPNLSRAHLPGNNSHHSFSSQLSDQSNWDQSTNPPREWNQNLISAAAHGVNLGSELSDPSFYNHDPSSLNVLNSHPNSSLGIGVYNNDVAPNRNQVPQNVNSNLNQSVWGVRSGHTQRSIPTFRASSSNFRPGLVASSDEGQHIVDESYPSRHPRAFSNLRLHNVDRSGRTFTSSGRHRSYTEEGSFRDRLTPEGLLVVDHPAIYGSRNMHDQHRDMRLDIDNMSYEDLLALGERIGSVNTGLSDCLISRCLTESIYCASDLSQDEETCVICLEEYINMDDVGTLKVCGHDFHVGCIRKWLSMKNSCPICKASSVDDKMKEK